MKALYEKYKTYIYFGVLVIAIVFAFFFFFGGDDEAALVSQSPAGATQSQIGRDLLQQLLQLRSLELNEGIFSEPAFRLLQDFGQDIPPQPVGRQNPFAPF